MCAPPAAALVTQAATVSARGPIGVRGPWACDAASSPFPYQDVRQDLPGADSLGVPTSLGNSTSRKLARGWAKHMKVLSTETGCTVTKHMDSDSGAVSLFEGASKWSLRFMNSLIIYMVGHFSSSKAPHFKVSLKSQNHG